MRDDEEYWDGLAGRIIERIEQQRNASWRSVAVWAPPLAAAAVLMMVIARGGHAPAADRAPSVAVMLTSEVQPPNIVALLGERR